MFVKSSNRSRRKKTYGESSLFSVLSAESLLASDYHQELLQRLFAAISLNQDDYDLLFKPLITNFAECVQMIPVNIGGKLGGLLNQSLNRAIRFVELIMKDSNHLSLDPAYIYAAFSATLLKNIYYLYENKKIAISNQDGSFISWWNPLEEFIKDKGQYYKIRSCYTGIASNAINLLFAKNLMPEIGFLWIIEDARIFAFWVALLTQEDLEGSMVVPTFILNLFKELRDLDLQLEVALPAELEILDPEDTRLGEEFWEWLKKSVYTNELEINQKDGLIYHVNEGLFLDYPEIFKAFNNFGNKPGEWIVVYKQFNALGLTKLSGYDKRFEQYFTESPNAVSKIFRHIKEGLVIENTRLIFSAKDTPALSSNLRALNKQNNWQDSLERFNKLKALHPELNINFNYNYLTNSK